MPEGGNFELPIFFSENIGGGSAATALRDRELPYMVVYRRERQAEINSELESGSEEGVGKRIIGILFDLVSKSPTLTTIVSQTQSRFSPHWLFLRSFHVPTPCHTGSHSHAATAGKLAAGNTEK